jgi:predicted CoA-binding protein
MNTKTQHKIAQIISEELKKSDVIDMFKKDKDFEKQVKKITSDVITDLFRVLWQHNGIFKNLAK